MSERLTVLVFDDDLVRRQGFLEGVAPPGLDVAFVYRAHADAAVADVEAVGPAMVLMDYSMGTRVSGAQAVAALRARWDRDALPILGISSEPRCNASMGLAGANDGIVKSYAPRRLAAVLAAHVAGRPLGEALSDPTTGGSW